jgi:DNA-binding CsgD family transcriptional regulator
MAARWSAQEDQILRRLCAQKRPVQEIAARVGRSPDAVVARRSSLGIAARPRSRSWSAQEEMLLRVAIAGGVSVSAKAVRLDRSRDQVRACSRNLVVPRPPARPYLPHEDEAIVRCVLDGDDLAALALRLGRSPDAVRVHAQQLGLRRPRCRRRWEEWEDAAVRDGYTSGLTCAEIARRLQRRTRGSVAARARKLGLCTYARRWSASDDRRLAQLAALSVALEQAALHLGRTPEAVRRRASRREIKLRPPHRADSAAAALDPRGG